MELFSEFGVKVVTGQRFLGGYVEIVRTQRNMYSSRCRIGHNMSRNLPTQLSHSPSSICSSNEVTAG